MLIPSALRVTACENTVLTMSCYEQDVIQVINAHYGRLDSITCDANIGSPDTKCLVNGTRDVVYTRSVVDACYSIIITGPSTHSVGGPD